MYRVFLVLHQWLALVVGICIIAIALTGVVVVFEGPVVRNVAPKVAPTGARLSLDSLAGIASASAHGGAIAFVSGGDSPESPYRFGVGQPPSTEWIDINPYSGAVMPVRTRPTRPEAFVRTAH